MLGREGSVTDRLPVGSRSRRYDEWYIAELMHEFRLEIIEEA